MTELLKNAWLGWIRFTDGGKLAAVLLSALLFLWLSGRWKSRKALFSYTVLTVLLCIVPATAAVLMLYQTRFYDYEWIWSLVPMTVTAAWGITEFLDGQWKNFSPSRWRQGLPVTLLLLAVLLLCGGPGENSAARKAQAADRKRAGEVVSQVLEGREGDVCLWAPREILEQARRQSGSLKLLYGRNMWEESLNAYTYDTYSREIRELYLWMENVGPAGTALVEDTQWGTLMLDGESCMAAAARAGVNCVLLPGSLDLDVAETLAGILGGRAVRLDAYYLLAR